MVLAFWRSASAVLFVIIFCLFVYLFGIQRLVKDTHAKGHVPREGAGDGVGLEERRDDVGDTEGEELLVAADDVAALLTDGDGERVRLHVADKGDDEGGAPDLALDVGGDRGDLVGGETLRAGGGGVGGVGGRGVGAADGPAVGRGVTGRAVVGDEEPRDKGHDDDDKEGHGPARELLTDDDDKHKGAKAHEEREPLGLVEVGSEVGKLLPHEAARGDLRRRELCTGRGSGVIPCANKINLKERTPQRLPI